MATRLVPDRTLALMVGYVATDWVQKPSLKVYDDALADWDAQVMERDGSAIGAVFRKGLEVHVSVLKPWRGRWMTRGLIRQILSEPGCFTRVMPGHSMAGVLERLGFQKRGDVFVRDEAYGH